ncbi:MAG TPA: ABC transporter ATP-binding protein [Rhabdochlamydiaceae bacterium]|jgi:ATP-binding cassette subfamily B protein|nr:ABC transporter ATP-binding protein [Rhabdochlamydiaceae bacterium]
MTSKIVSYKELIGFFWKFVRKQKWTFFSIFIQDCVNTFDSLLWPFILRWVIDVFTQHEASRAEAWELLQTPIIISICLIVFIEINSRAMGFLMAKAVPRLQADIRMTMFDHIQEHSPRYFNERFAGSLANKITDMTSAVESIIQQLFWPIISSIAMALFGAIFLWFVHPILAGILIVWIVVHLGICLMFSKTCDLYEHRHGESRSTLLGKIVDSLTNYFAVNLFYRFRFEKSALVPYQNEEERTNVSARRYVEKMRSVTSFFYITLCFFGINGVVIYLWLQNQITTGEVAQVFSTTWNISAVMWALGGALPYFFQAFGIAKQAYVVMLDPQDMGDKPGAKKLKIQDGEIIFENVSFHYGEKKLFSNKQAHIRGGEKVGLVGFTGAGKSTFISLILRFFPLHGGKILIDGQNIADITLGSLRRQIALIPQDPVLFHRTLRENISYGKPEATEEEIFAAAELAHCDEFIQNIPAGYEAKVGERGTKLSGGEKQRIAIARAILVDAPILILDEATSSLDSVTEKYIQDSLSKLMQGRTTIVIAHRLSTLSRMDRILVFDKGKIVEEGTHAALMSKNGLYAQMWNMQVGGFLPETPVHR